MCSSLYLCKHNDRHPWLSAAIWTGIALSPVTDAHAWDIRTAKPEIVIHMAGSTLADGFLHDVLRDTLCDSDTVWINASPLAAADSATGIASTYWGAACSLKTGAVPSIKGNPRLLFLKNGMDSSWGVYPLVQTVKGATAGSYATQKPADFPDIGKCEPGTASSGWNWNCGGNQKALIDAGLSQIEPAMYLGANRPDDKSVTDITPAQLALLSVTPFAAGLYGVTVNLNFRNALQEIQFGGPGNGCVNQESLACMPSLSRSQIIAVLTGQIQSWDQWHVQSGGMDKSMTDESLTSAAYRTGSDSRLSGFDRKVYICSRQKGAGTLAVFNAMLLNSPCSSNGGLRMSGGNAVTGPVVTVNTATEFEQCMTELDTGVLASGSKFTFPSATRAWAIGMQGTEKNATRKKAYRFIRIDNIAPIQSNVWNGSYPLWAEFTLQWRTKMKGATAASFMKTPNPGANAVASSTLNSGSNKLAILTVMARAAGNAGAIARFNAGKAHHGFGDAGYMALAGAFSDTPLADTSSYRPENPVLGYRHQNPVTSQLNTCSPATPRKPLSGPAGWPLL